MLPLKKPNNAKNPNAKNPLDAPSSNPQFDITVAHQMLRANSTLDYKTNIHVVTCLKLAEMHWGHYCEGNKNGQSSSECLARLKKIDLKLNNEIDKIIVNGSVEQVRNVRDILKPAINYLQNRSRKFLEHQNEFKMISRKVEEVSLEQEEQEDEIKREMLELVDKFKHYAVNIQEDLVNDEKVIDDIGKMQDKQIDSLQSKSQAMNEIISQQRIGFFQLVGMGIIAILAWLFGMMVIIIV